MFKKRKNYNLYQSNNIYLKQKPNISNIIRQTKSILNNENIQQPTFQRPKTETEWMSFHKTNEEGLKQAYQKPEGYHIEDNKLYIAGTRGLTDVLDWYKIPLGTFNSSHIYKNIEPILKDNPNIDTVIGHSAGGSAALELEKNFPDRNITSITYNAPVFERATQKQNQQPMRFAIAGDPVSMLDANAQTTYKAPNFTDPVVLGLHTINDSYSKPSNVMDFIKSGGQAVEVGRAIGIL